MNRNLFIIGTLAILISSSVLIACNPTTPTNDNPIPNKAVENSTHRGTNNLPTFTIAHEGKEVTVTQQLDTKFMGEYLQQKGADNTKYRVRISLEKDKSYVWKQTALQVGNETAFNWMPEEKHAIEWGVVTNNDEIALADFDKLVGKELKSFDAMTLLYKDVVTNEVGKLYLYEDNGIMYLGNASKADKDTEFAGNK